ncbi:hemerythrin domain-containing protein [Microbacterium hominis]|uniref:Hemerythrin domain-containing protein n=1 Tax=Microbacterium hominis TaxID=162426 RepID=A0A7D4Q2J5_9MICO|nr:hemerythrin domain-containing protein [Microbacterium hominis]QKJ19471.1 hemerythrin domain-containing protein [Microbacterium hominis]
MTTNDSAAKAQPAPAWGCRTDDILVAHAVFRRLFSLLPPAVRAAEDFDQAHARRVCARIRLATSGLHHHHRTEDTMLWDRLEDRAPTCALHVGLMRAQHDDIAAQLEVIDGLAAAWRLDGDPDIRDRLAERLVDVDHALRTHLRDEEAKVLPVVAVVMSQLEWDDVGARARRGTAPQTAFAMLGLMLAEADPAQRAEFEAHIPRIARVLYSLFGHVQYDRLLADLAPAPASPGTGFGAAPSTGARVPRAA